MSTNSKTNVQHATQHNGEMRNLCEDMIAKARKKGADFADIYAYRSTSISTSIRNGQQDDFEREEDVALGLRVFVDKSSACLSTSDLRTEASDKIIDQALIMARNVPEDEFAQYPDECLTDMPVIANLTDPEGEPQPDALNALALEMESLGLAQDGISKSDGADCSWSSSTIVLCNSVGFNQSYQKDYCGASLSLIGGEGVNMERDYAYDQCAAFANLDSAKDIALSAAERTIQRLNPQKGKTGTFPVIYDRRVANTLIRHMLAAINGGRIAKNTSFLNDSMGKAIFQKDVTIHDNPHMDGMLKSRFFDSEGQNCSPMQLVQDGVLENWILDLRSAHKLGLQTNGRASRGLASQPSPSSTNVWMDNGTASLNDLLADIKDGFYVTELIGSSVSMTTGNYSRGASGFWIENGKISHAVSEMTLAGNLKDMFASLIPATDLRLRYGCDSPSIYIPSMSLASA